LYIWRKRAGTRWLRGRGESLARRFGGSLAVIQRPGTERVLLEICCKTEQQTRELVREFGGNVERLRPDWLRHFARRARVKPLRIGSRLVILSAPEKDAVSTQVSAHARSVVIPAEAAFGTGEHATTAMCLRLLERVTRQFQPGWKMLDTGTGSGILAIAGSYFGARRVLAIDSDPLACATAKRNARANRVRNIEVRTGDILKHKLAGKFDIITANIFSEILIDALPIWSRHLAAEARVILSGILRGQETTVSRALRRHGFVIPEIRRRGKWIALVARLEEQKGS
jgi:ribosomal protein L11 methyltransferase